MNNTSETLNTFLNALDTFRSLLYGGKGNIDDVIEGFIRFFNDETNDLYIVSDRDNNAITEMNDYGQSIFLYTSLEDVIKETFDGKHADFIINNAYIIFKDILGKEDIDGAYINVNVEPAVYVPKFIIKKVVESVDQLRSMPSDTNTVA